MTAPFGLSSGGRKLLWLAAALAAANALLLFAYTLPKFAENRSINARLARLRQEEQELKGQLARQRTAVETRSANARDAQRFLREIATSRKPELLSSIADIQGAARELGLEAPAVAFSEKPLKDAPLTEFAIRMPLSGTYAQIVTFLGRMERSSRFIAVDQLSLARGEAGQKPKLEVGLTAFFKADGESTP